MKHLALAIAASLLPISSLAETKIVTWNAGVAWDGAIEARDAEFKAAGEAIDADVYVLQEVMSLAGAEEIAALLGVQDPQIVVSDFASVADQRRDEDKANPLFHLEVAVISEVPIVSATELEFDMDDRDGPLTNVSGLPVSRLRFSVPFAVWDRISDQSKDALPFGRGVLRVELEGDIVLYVVHAKSDISGYCSNASDAIRLLDRIERRSGDSGLSDQEIAKLGEVQATLEALIAEEEATSFSQNWITNAEKREAIFAAVSWDAMRDVDDEKTVVALGDFNIAIDDPRSGSDLEVDCNPTRSCTESVEDMACQDQDGLDESHFLISGGLFEDFSMTPLTAGLEETLLGEFSSVIDHIYVAGPKADAFSAAAIIRDASGAAFGSDHLPVVTTLSD